MKVSTSANSCKIKRRVGGLIFGRLDKETYKSVYAWVKAGKPNDVYIYDHVDTLKVCGIPICDAVYARGLYMRSTVRPKRDAEVMLIRGFIRELRPAVVKSKSDGIQLAETKDHHKMIY